MAKTLVGLFDTFSQAQNVVDQLINAGIDRSRISLVSRNRDQAATTTDADIDNSSAAEAAGAGAIGGTVLGGTLGLLIGIGALAIPGIGPVVAAGPLAAALGSTALGAGIGAAAGGLIGALVGAGVPEEDANLYAEGVRRGGTLVTVHVEDAMSDSAYMIMQQAGAADIDTKGAGWRGEGWDRFDENADPYNVDDNTGSKWEQSSKVGTAGGTVAGAATGAAMGSVGGPVGTVIGGIAGAVTGAGVGAAGDAAGEAAEDTAQSGGVTDTTSARRRGLYDNRTGGVGTDLESNWEESSKIGTGGGALAGAATGAAAGSVGGPVGTVIGGVAGAVTGAGLGAGADAASEGIKDEVRHGDSDNMAGRRSDTEMGSDTRSNWEESSKVGTAGGTVAGAATGAAIGSVGGPVGTVIGGVAGAVTGAGAGAAGDAAGEAAEDHTMGDTSRSVGDHGWGWSDYERDFRSDYDTRYTSSGYTWDNYSTAYRYGYDVASDPRYKGRHWNDIEGTLRGGWDESRYGPWDRFKDAVQHAWERTKDAVR